MKRRRIIVIVIAVALVVLMGARLYSNKRKINRQNQVVTSVTRVAVGGFKVVRRQVPYELSLLGTIIPNREVNVVAETQGQIVVLPFDRGDYKGKGAVLARVETDTRRAALESAQANLEKARDDLKRYEVLFAGNAATAQQLQETKLAFTTAESNLVQSRQQYEKATITAPFSGIITEKNVEAGSVILTGNVIARMVDVSSLKVNVNVSETDAYRLRLNDTVSISTAVYPGVRFRGQISFISPVADQAHSYPVEVTLRNTREHPLKAGTYVTVHFRSEGATREAIYIPRPALVGSVAQPQVYVVERGVARLRNITLGQSDSEQLQVLSGLREGEVIVVSGLINLKDNTPVQLSAPSANPSAVQG